MSYDIYWHRRKNTICPDDNPKLKKIYNYKYISPYDKEGNKKPFTYESTNINITSNLSNMFSWAFNSSYWVDGLNCRKGKEIIPLITEAINKMKNNKEEAETYNAPNGWGTYPYALQFLIDLLNSAIYYKNYYLEINR